MVIMLMGILLSLYDDKTKIRHMLDFMEKMHIQFLQFSHRLLKNILNSSLFSISMLLTLVNCEGQSLIQPSTGS